MSAPGLFKRWYFFFITFIFLFPLAAWAAPTPGGSPAKDSPVKIKVEVGWQGQGVAGITGPAVVHLENRSSKAISGVAEVVEYYKFTPESFPDSQVPFKQTRYIPTGAYGQQVTLPPKATKKVVLWFPLPGAQGKAMFSFRSGTKVMAGTEVKVSGQNIKPFPAGGAVGVIGDVPPALKQAGLTVHAPEFQNPPVISLTSELLPVNGEELEAFGVILVTHKGAAGLTAHQGRILLDWVEQGGHLVVAGGPGVEKTLSAFPEDVIWAVSQPGASHNLQKAARWLGVDASKRVTGSAPVVLVEGRGRWWGPKEQPLGSQTGLGKGEITVLTFDPTQEPWFSGDLGKALWQAFLKPLYNEFGLVVFNSFQKLSSLVSQVDKLPAEAFPGRTAIASYMLVFLLAAGPVTYWFFRRLGYPGYVWIAVPLLSLMFTGAVYLYMVRTGRNVIANVLQVVDTTSSRSKGYTAAGFFAPTFPVFDVALGDQGHQVKVENIFPAYDQPDPGEIPFSITRDSDIKLHFGKTSRWGMRPVTFRMDVPKEASGLTAKLRLDGSGLKGTVSNRTGKRLDHVTLVLGKTYKNLGSMKPGGEAEVVLPVPPLPSYNASGISLPFLQEGWGIFLYPDGSIPDMKNYPNIKPPRKLAISEQRRANMLANWFQSSRGPLQEETGWPLTLLAWSSEPVKEITVKGPKNKVHYLSMFVARPEIDWPAGSFEIPFGLIPPDLSGMFNQSSFGFNGLTGIGNGQMTFFFRPNLPAGARIQEIQVHLPFFPANKTTGMSPEPQKRSLPPQPVAPGALEIYHPGRDCWEGLSGAKTFTLPGEYALPGGEVQLRVKGMGSPPAETAFYFLSPVVAYKGVIE
ncbi:MAG: hypothetical protein AB1510_08450 [Bacillota bacterium]